MPTKPVVQPEAWATNALYTTGPFIGSASKVVPAVGVAAEGHRPGANFPTAAEHENSQQNRLTALARWVFLGSFNPDVDAHIVETAADGRASLHGLDIVNLLDQVALSIASSVVNFPAIQAIVTTGATIFYADPGNSNAICYEASVKAGDFPVGFKATMTSAGIAARGVLVTGDAGSGGVGVDVNVDGSTTAATFRSDGSASSVVTITSNGTGVQRGLTVNGAGVGEAIRSTSSSSPGAWSIFAALANNTGRAIWAQTTAGATSTARAIFAEARLGARAIEATAVNGDGISAVSTGVGGSALFLPGRATDPTVTFNGHADFNTVTGTWVHSDQDASEYRDFWSSRGGIAIGASTGAQLVHAPTVTYVTACTLALTGQDAPHRANARVTLRFTCDARTVAAATGGVNVRVTDTTSGLVIFERSGLGVGPTNCYALTDATTDWQRPIVFDVNRTVPLAGDRTFLVEVATPTANAIQVRDPKLVPFGCYN